MDLFPILLTVVGLSLFEVITSIDNAIVNAEVLSGMSAKARRWFLVYGFFLAVFVVRGALPFLMIWFANPGIGIPQAFWATLSGDETITAAIKESSRTLLIGGGIFLIFIFLHWLFLEEKHYGIRGEKFFYRQGAWFFAVVSILLSVIVWFALKENPLMAFGAVLGSSTFFIVHGFRQYAQEQERKLVSGSGMSDISKLAYLEVLDASFSIDGVVGAFAFTFSVPLILLGNGLGALVLRRLTISNIDRIKRYKYLKNGAMYSILFLGVIMILESFEMHIPVWLSPVVTIGAVLYFFQKSKMDLAAIESVLQKKKKK